jgi:hypothetical protein
MCGGQNGGNPFSGGACGIISAMDIARVDLLISLHRHTPITSLTTSEKCQT